MAKTEIGHRQAKVLFLYAAKDFEVLKNMNSLRNVDINRVVEAEKAFKDQAKYATVAPLDKVRRNAFGPEHR